MYYFPISKQRITLPFAATDKPYSVNRPHSGLDLAPFPGSFGEPITLPWMGMVISKQYSNTGLGNAVALQCSLPFAVVTTTLKKGLVTINPDNLFIMRMGHMQSIESVVREGEMLEAGTIVGKIGSTGFSTGPHVHIDIKTNAGDFVDPLPILRQALEQNSKPVSPVKRLLKIYSDRQLIHEIEVPEGKDVISRADENGNVFVDIRA